VTFGGVIQDGAGTVGLVKTAAAPLSLTGANTYTGTTDVNEGALVVNGSLAAGGIVNVNGNTSFAGSGSEPAAPWRVTGLPQQTKPYTRFSVVDVDGVRALKVDADKSYGNLVHTMRIERASGQLSWRWRIDQFSETADLRERSTEDIAVKVCTMWDLPLERVPFIDRQAVRILRSRTDDAVPAATVCYVWDPRLPVGSQVDSPFTRRLRYIVLRSGTELLRKWTPEQRDIAADFFKLFGDEAKGELPPLIGVAVGADSDNTRTHTVAHVADLALKP